MPLYNHLRRWVPIAVRRRLREWRGLPPKLHSDWSLLETIGRRADPHVVFDVGAHVGWFTMCWKHWCPAAVVHAFEPTPESFGRLEQNVSSLPNVTCIAAAAGATAGEATLNQLADSRVSNSLLEPDQGAWQAIHYQTGAVQTVTVPVVRLDEHARAHGVERLHLLKIDVQGFELGVLEGARDLLTRTDHVFVESAIRPLYKGAARFDQVFDFLVEQGFHLMAMQAWHRGNRVLIETDMLFRRNGLEPAVDDSIVRIYDRTG